MLSATSGATVQEAMAKHCPDPTNNNDDDGNVKDEAIKINQPLLDLLAKHKDSTGQMVVQGLSIEAAAAAAQVEADDLTTATASASLSSCSALSASSRPPSSSSWRLQKQNLQRQQQPQGSVSFVANKKGQQQ
jgi:hypothetical protein